MNSGNILFLIENVFVFSLFLFFSILKHKGE